MPSILELYDVYKNKDVIKNSLDLVGGFDLDSNWYWSSSQAYSKNEGAYGILFPTGEVTNVYKYFIILKFNEHLKTNPLKKLVLIFKIN